MEIKAQFNAILFNNIKHLNMKKVYLSITAMFIAIICFAQNESSSPVPDVIDGPCIVIKASSFKETKALNMLLNQDQINKIDFEEIKEMPDRKYRKAQTFKYSVADGPEYGNDKSKIQTTMGTRSAKAVLTQWEGQNGGSSPQDPTGAASLTQYVQSVNNAPFAVYDKNGTGTPVFTGDIATVAGSSFSMGDPIVLYDKFADRWLVAVLNFFSGIAVAVSQTNDPAGAYYAWQYNTGMMPDYYKFSVWENGYYMTSNNGSGKVFCFERDAMLVGDPSARSISKTFTEPTNAGFGFWLPIPADADGLIPPSGERCPFFAYTDNGWGGSEIDAIKIWTMGVTWGATPSADITLDATLPTSAFDASYDSNWNDITQPGSQKLDGIGGVCMWRAPWYSFVGTNRVVLNWAVKINASQRSIMWVELRQDQLSGVWSIYQEGIYAPDSENRWCGSMGIDCNGDIALCYAKASSTTSVSLAYTGRIPTDTLGTMSLAETVVFSGSGSITGSNRFGDYSHTALDPVDGSTFWHTGMYSNNGSRTGIYSFEIAPCTVGIDDDESFELIFNAYQSGKLININASGLPLDNEYKVQLFDISGKKISEKTIESSSKSVETTIDVSGLLSGIYLVRIGSEDFQRVTKLALQF